MAEEFDFLIIGSGMAGLSAGALLAHAGHSVCLLEAHEHPGGCAHSFPMGPYTFCAAVHYIFYCGEGEPVFNLLKKLGLHETVTFERLDPNGYDHFSCPEAGIRLGIPNGLDCWAERLIDRFPEHRTRIRGFFDVVRAITRELRDLPYEWSWREYFNAIFRSRAILRYRRWTLQNLFDRLALPAEVQAVLATQVGDLGLPPERVSLVIYAALIWSYGLGAYHPTHHFRHLVESLANVIRQSPRSEFLLNAEVSRLSLRSGRLTEAVTRDGRVFRARVFLANTDPKTCVELIGREHFSSSFLRKIEYSYSVSSYTVYLAIRDIDLRACGFGNWNIWHYPHLDLNRAYRDQVDGNDLSNPWLFLSTPTLCAPRASPRACPDGEEILEVVTVAGHDSFASLRHNDRRAYNKKKREITAGILKLIERHYIPGLRDHLTFKLSGTPATNVRYLWAPAGNIYGSELTPANVDFDRLRHRTPIPNLFLTGASSAFPSVGATVLGGSRLYTRLTGDPVNPARDLHGTW